MKLRGLVQGIGVFVLLAAAVAAQQGPAPLPPAASPPPGRSGDTPRHAASAAAAARAIALCSGLWSGGQSREMIDRDNPPPVGLPDAQIDAAARVVAVGYDRDMPPRLVLWRPVLGCVLAPPGATRADLAHLPRTRPDLTAPDLDARDWPTGDANARGSLDAARQRALDAVVDAAFDGATYGARTWGVVVVKDGRIVAERYAEGYGAHVGEQTHSAAKSFAASIVGLAVRQYGLDLRRAPALAEWDRPGDPRRAITVEHLIRMSSGLYGEGNGSPLLEIYNGGGTVAGRAATNVLDTLPGTRFLYNPPDTMLMMRAVRQRVADDARYLAMPFTDFFWRIGMTRTVTSSDWNGDFQMSGQTYSTARDFARFGILYLNDGVWAGERLLPEGWSRYVATPGPAQPAGAGPRYGAHFWLYGGIDGLPPDAYTPSGGLGQYAMIIPSENVVVVRRGHDPATGGFRIARFSADVVAALGGKGAAAGTSRPADRAVPGEVVVEPPTLNALGFEWPLAGDANRNATVSLRYRAKGSAAWREGLPPLRLGGEETKYLAIDFTAPSMFAGSVFDLVPDTTYEVALRLTDPDGVVGQAERLVEVRTRREPRPATDGRTFHVYPQGYQGERQQPAFNGLLAAFNMGASHSDWFNTFLPRVRPGDVILVHAGLYKDTRYRYGSGSGTLFDGTYYLTASGTAERPIVIRAAGDGPVVFDGDGNGVLFDVTAANHLYFEGLTFRNTEIAILAGRKRMSGSEGLTVKRSRFEDVGIGITTDWSGSRDFYVADNVFVGRQIPGHLMGWIGRTWQSFPDFPVPLRSNYAVKVYGSGHVIAHNDVSHFHDGIDHATYGNPDVDAQGRILRERMPVSIDIVGNDIRNVDDNCIEADGAMHNIRVLRNRCFNHAHRALSAQPLLGGPAYFIRNVVYHAPEGGSLKLQANPSGIVFYHNTLVAEAHDMGPVSNVHFRNNLILGQGAWPEIFTVDTFTNYSSSDHNGFRPNPGASAAFGWNSPPRDVVADFRKDREARRFGSLREYAAATGQDRHSVLVDYGDFVRVSAPDPADPRRFYGPQEFDFTLRPGSRAVDAGVVLPGVNDGYAGRAPDLGAYERGQPVPHYGPRVADATPQF